MSADVLASLVTFNDEADLGECLDSLGRQSIGVRIKVWDNASGDRCCEIARHRGVAVHRSMTNLGCSRAHNLNLAGEEFRYALLLNADVILSPDFLEVLVESLEAVEGAGMAGGKLHRMGRGGETVCRDGRPVLDSTGIYFTPAQRHFDRGSQEADRGQYERRQLVFGVTGAAMLCSRAMLEDVSVEGEVLDEHFFAYREDADLAWRAQLRGWKAVYEPRARGLHRRRVLPSRRSQLAAAINYHSLKNRYLLRAKNMDAAVRRRCFPYMWIRDLGILGYVLLRERSSLGAYREVWRLGRVMQEKRRRIQAARRVPPRQIARWFSFTPVAFDV